jgi:hypothetical protein
MQDDLTGIHVILRNVRKRGVAAKDRIKEIDDRERGNVFLSPLFFIIAAKAG